MKPIRETETVRLATEKERTRRTADPHFPRLRNLTLHSLCQMRFSLLQRYTNNSVSVGGDYPLKFFPIKKHRLYAQLFTVIAALFSSIPFSQAQTPNVFSHCLPFKTTALFILLHQLSHKRLKLFLHTPLSAVVNFRFRTYCSIACLFLPNCIRIIIPISPLCCSTKSFENPLRFRRKQ